MCISGGDACLPCVNLYPSDTICVICVNCGHLDPVVWCIVKLQPVLSKCEAVCGVMMWSDDVMLSFLDIDHFGHLMYFHVDCASFHDCAYPLFRIAMYAVQHLLNFWSFPGALCVPLCVHYSFCVIMYMCLLQCFLYIPMCTCVHMFFLDGIYL